MDFKEDQLAIESHVRMRCNWRSDDEITDEEWLIYSLEYIEQTPFFSDVVKLPREAMIYDRLAGEVTFWKRLPKTELYWQKGRFWSGMYVSIRCIQLKSGWVRQSRECESGEESTLRKLGVYFGLIEDKTNIFGDRED